MRATGAVVAVSRGALVCAEERCRFSEEGAGGVTAARFLFREALSLATAMFFFFGFFFFHNFCGGRV